MYCSLDTIYNPRRHAYSSWAPDILHIRMGHTSYYQHEYYIPHHRISDANMQDADVIKKVVFLRWRAGLHTDRCANISWLLMCLELWSKRASYKLFFKDILSANIDSDGSMFGQFCTVWFPKSHFQAAYISAHHTSYHNTCFYETL